MIQLHSPIIHRAQLTLSKKQIVSASRIISRKVFSSKTTDMDTNQTPATADLCDAHIPSPTRLQIVQPDITRFQSYGKRSSFHGRVHTIRCFESNPLVREVLSSPPSPLSGEDGETEPLSPDVKYKHGHVLVVDGGGSHRCAIMGDMLATFATENGWNGVVINGYIRDSKIINTLDIGVKALGTHPLKSLKDYKGECGGRVAFGGVEFVQGDYLYSDEDGIVVSEVPLEA